MPFSNAVASVDFDGNTANWDGLTLRQIIPAATVLVGGPYVRLTISAASGGASDFQSMYLGYAAASGDAYDFASSPVQITVASATSFTVSVGETQVCDTVAFPLVPGTNLILSAYIGADPNSGLRYQSGMTSHSVYSKSGDDASTVDATGYSLFHASRRYVVKLIEARSGIKTQHYRRLAA